MGNEYHLNWVREGIYLTNPEKAITSGKLNFMIILNALHQIATKKGYEAIFTTEQYFAIGDNMIFQTDGFGYFQKVNRSSVSGKFLPSRFSDSERKRCDCWKHVLYELFCWGSWRLCKCFRMESPGCLQECRFYRRGKVLSEYFWLDRSNHSHKSTANFSKEGYLAVKVKKHCPITPLPSAYRSRFS